MQVGKPLVVPVLLQPFGKELENFFGLIPTNAGQMVEGLKPLLITIIDADQWVGRYRKRTKARILEAFRQGLVLMMKWLSMDDSMVNRVLARQNGRH